MLVNYFAAFGRVIFKSDMSVIFVYLCGPYKTYISVLFVSLFLAFYACELLDHAAFSRVSLKKCHSVILV